MSVSSLLVYAIVASFTPGPNNLMSLYFATQTGFKKAMRFVSGVFTGFVILLSLSGLLNHYLGAIFPKIEWLMKIIGAIYLLYLAYLMIAPTKGKQKKINDEWNTTSKSTLLQFVNPKGVLYAITVMGTFITPFFQNTVIILAFAVFLALISFLGSVTWAIFGSGLKHFISKYEKSFNIIMALLLIYTAITIFTH